MTARASFRYVNPDGTFNLDGLALFAASGESGAVAWGDVTGKPSTFTPSAHTHVIDDVTGLQVALDGKQAAGSYAASTHGHVVGDVTGLQTALDGKQPAGSYAAATHTHTATAISDSTAAGRALLTASTATAQTALLDTFTSGAKGLAPASGGGTATFLRADGSWSAPIVQRAGFVMMAPAAGVFIANTADATALGTQAQVADRTVIAPFVSAYDVTIDQVGVSVSTLLAGANAKVVIYAADANGRPSTILRESGNISAAATGTVFAAVTALQLVGGTRYWIGVRASGTFTLRTLGVSALPVLSYTNAATPVAQSALIVTETFGNAAANWSYATSQHSNALVPLVLMRAA